MDYMHFVINRNMISCYVEKYFRILDKECSENKFLISERVNSIHFEPGLR